MQDAHFVGCHGAEAFTPVNVAQLRSGVLYQIRLAASVSGAPLQERRLQANVRQGDGMQQRRRPVPP